MTDSFPGRAASIVAALLFVVAVVVIARRAAPMFPVSDEAVTELATLNAVHGRQLLGPYSRYPWHHPGPALFYLLAPFYEITGRRATGLAAGALSVNLVALGLAAWVLFRRGGPALALACVAAMAVVFWRAPGVLASPWNPHIATIVASSVVMVSASAAASWPAAIPLVVCLASIAVQTHVATLPLAAISFAVASFSFPGASSSERLPRVAVRTAMVLAALWLVPIAEQMMPGGGNIGRLWRFATTPSAGAGWTVSIQAWADALLSVFRSGFGVPLGLLVPQDGGGWTLWAACAELALLASVAVWARATGRHVYFWMAVQLFTTSVVSLWAVSRIPDGIHDHEVFWIAAIGALNAGVIIAWPLALANLDGWRTSSSIVLALVIAGVAAAGADQVLRMVNRSHDLSFNDRLVRNLASAVNAEITRTASRKTTILIDQRVWPAAAGVILQLRKSGRVLAVEPDLAHMFSGTLAADGSEDLEVSFCGGPCHELQSARPGNVVVWLGDGVAVDAIRRTGGAGK